MRAPWRSSAAWASPRKCARPACRRAARWTCSSCSRWSSRRSCTCPTLRSSRHARRSPRATTARCRSSPISSSRNTRSSRCSNRSRRRLPPVSVRYGCEFLDFEAGRGIRHGERAEQRGATSQIRARYLVGCDGGSSLVRKQLGIALRGEGNLLQLRQALYRCDELFERIPIGKGRHYHVADDARPC